MKLSYLVDTDWAIHYLNGQDRIRKRLEEHSEGGLALSLISLAEIYEGIYFSTNPEGNEKGLNEFLKDVTLIGITARQNDLTLLTNNRRHFENIEDLRIESVS